MRTHTYPAPLLYELHPAPFLHRRSQVLPLSRTPRLFLPFWVLSLWCCLPPHSFPASFSNTDSDIFQSQLPPSSSRGQIMTKCKHLWKELKLIDTRYKKLSEPLTGTAPENMTIPRLKVFTQVLWQQETERKSLEDRSNALLQEIDMLLTSVRFPNTEYIGSMQIGMGLEVTSGESTFRLLSPSIGEGPDHDVKTLPPGE